MGATTAFLPHGGDGLGAGVVVGVGARDRNQGACPRILLKKIRGCYSRVVGIETVE